jgi:glycosyltransferase involved in cell wall biosynthesis
VTQITIADPVGNPAKTEFLTNSSLFFHPSRIEGAPLAVLEAWAAARPVAVTPGTNFADLADDWRAGLRIASPLAESVRDTMRLAASLDPTELFEMGQRGRQLVEHSFSWHKAGRQLASLYYEYLSLPNSSLQTRGVQ